MREIFKVGEKVRLLHAKGEGIVQKLISPTKIEVLIDEFYEMELGVDEVVKINAGESILRNEEEAEADNKPKKKGIGPSLTPAPDLPPSFVLFKNADQDYEFWLLNQGRNEVLFTCFIKVGNKFISYNSGSVMPRENHFIGRQTPAEFHQARSIYLQVLQFPRIEHPKPIAPITLEVNCKTDIFVREPQSVPELNVQGWEFVIQERIEVQPTEMGAEGMADVRFTAQKPPKPPKVVDLHIHKIISNPLGIDSHTMMRLQLEHFEKAITDAQAHHLDSMVFIHGIGNGTLKKEIHHRLKGYVFVKHFELADPVEYGNGATIVFF